MTTTHRALRWCNLGDKTVESTCIEERKDVAISFAIPHKQNAQGLYTLIVKVFKGKTNISTYQIPSLTFSQAKAYPNKNMDEIMGGAREAAGPITTQ